MIKAGIIGAATPQAGELIRLLVHHPDAEIAWLYAPAHAGSRVVDVHHGMIGDTDLTFSARRDAADANAIFIAESDTWADELCAPGALPDDVRVIDMRPDGNTSPRQGFEYGLSEINRKPLVRGARRAFIASPAAAAVLVSLYPLASHLLLAGDASIRVSAPSDLLTPDALDAAAAEIESRLREVQKSFGGHILFQTEGQESPRTMRVRMSLPIALSQEEIEGLYEGIYDDHNFSFMLRHPAEWKEVAGTNKCLISLSKPSPTELEIDTVIDCRLRGNAGEALHVMNLLWGLAERTGLNLHASEY